MPFGVGILNSNWKCQNTDGLYLMANWGRLQNCEKRLLAPSCLTVRPSAWNNLASTGPIYVKFETGIFFKYLLRSFKCHLILSRITGTLHEDKFNFFLIMSR